VLHDHAALKGPDGRAEDSGALRSDMRFATPCPPALLEDDALFKRCRACFWKAARRKVRCVALATPMDGPDVLAGDEFGAAGGPKHFANTMRQPQ
jgi:hypothetical protein